MNSAPFTSDLSIDELLIAVEVGWEPIQIVSGECTVARAGAPRWSELPEVTLDLKLHTETLTHGRVLAVERMRTAASRAGADGVVGVRLDVTDLEPDQPSHPRHYAAIGTAVRRRARSRRTTNPFTSHLSGQDAFALIDAGYMPLRLVLGVSVKLTRAERRTLVGVTEMPALSAAIASTRESAIQAMQADARHAKARGVVAVTLQAALRPPRSDAGRLSRWRTECVAIGTSITTAPGGPRTSTPEPVVDLG